MRRKLADILFFIADLIETIAIKIDPSSGFVDTFSRTVSNGWGVADPDGSWSCCGTNCRCSEKAVDGA